jgi:DHA2 family multidrug resistance protein
MTSGRYVSTDDAYVQAGKVTIATDVSGVVAKVAVKESLRNIGSNVGISLVIFLLTRNTQIVHAELVGHVTPFNDALGGPGPSRFRNMATAAGRTALNAEVTKQASVVAYANDFKLMMIVALLALPLAFLLRRAKAQAGPGCDRFLASHSAAS